MLGRRASERIPGADAGEERIRAYSRCGCWGGEHQSVIQVRMLGR